MSIILIQVYHTQLSPNITGLCMSYVVDKEKRNDCFVTVEVGFYCVARLATSNSPHASVSCTKHVLCDPVLSDPSRKNNMLNKSSIRSGGGGEKD